MSSGFVYIHSGAQSSPSAVPKCHGRNENLSGSGDSAKTIDYEARTFWIKHLGYNLLANGRCEVHAPNPEASSGCRNVGSALPLTC